LQSRIRPIRLVDMGRKGGLVFSIGRVLPRGRTLRGTRGGLVAFLLLLCALLFVLVLASSALLGPQ
jgi:hypothetical protein